MTDTTPQTASRKLLWHFSTSLDGFVAGPGHTMDWMAGATHRSGLIDEYVATTGAILGGRAGWDAYPDPSGIYGGAWTGPVFVLTHHPDDATPTDGVTFLDCDVAEAARIALDAADGKNVEVLSASIGTQLLERGLLDEIDLHVLPRLLGDGIRLYDVAGGSVRALQNLVGSDPDAATNLRFRPVHD